jgi:D-alanyl-D-alanine endopeptidase (penicillin-binding protein 7)
MRKILWAWLLGLGVAVAGMAPVTDAVAQEGVRKVGDKTAQVSKQRKSKHSIKSAQRLHKSGKASKRKVSRINRAQQRDLSEYKTLNGQPVLRSAYALVLDQRTGELLYEKGAQKRTPIASITKLMTAMVVLDANLPMDEPITIAEADVDHLKYTRSRLPVGTRMSRGDLMHLALIASENRAAAALSREYPGGRDAFVAAMNRKADTLGMKDTEFHDGTGLSRSNLSTARDLARMVDAAYRYDAVREISSMGSYDMMLPSRRSMRELAYNNTNPLTRRKDWEIGVSKTGFINEAGHCLVMQARISHQPLIIVLLDSQGKYSRIGDANRIRRWIEEGPAQHIADRRKGRTT